MYLAKYKSRHSTSCCRQNLQLRIILRKCDGRDRHSLWNTQPPAHHKQTIMRFTKMMTDQTLT